MKQRKERGIAHLGVIVAVVIVVVAVAFGGWWVWYKNSDEAEKSSNSQANNNHGQESTNPSDDGKYLVIKEWGVRFELSADLKNNMSYSLGGDVLTDPDENQIQSLALLLRNDPTAKNDCALVDTSGGAFIDTATQILRIEKNKPFDITRYKGTFKETILSDNAYVYHLNYAPSVCAGPTAAAQIEQLQNILPKLQVTE